jgi:chaperone required for assembly of F1-ATPase
LANSVIDGVVGRIDDVVDDVAKYFGSDLLFYRAGHPDELIAREAQHWDPVLFWVADEFGAHFILAQGIIHVSQPEPAIAAARDAIPQDPWSVGAFHVVTTITGSALLALALAQSRLDPDQVWTAAHVDEDWNIERWGVDEEVAARRAARQVEFKAAAQVLAALSAAESSAGS